MKQTITITQPRIRRIPAEAIRSFIRRTTPAASSIFTALALIFLLAGSGTCMTISALLAFALITADDLIPKEKGGER